MLTGILVNQTGETFNGFSSQQVIVKFNAGPVKMNLQTSMISMSLNHLNVILAEKDRPGHLWNHEHGNNRSPTIVPNNRDLKRTDSMKLSLRISYRN